MEPQLFQAGVLCLFTTYNSLRSGGATCSPNGSVRHLFKRSPGFIQARALSERRCQLTPQVDPSYPLMRYRAKKLHYQKLYIDLIATFIKPKKHSREQILLVNNLSIINISWDNFVFQRRNQNQTARDFKANSSNYS